jgi:hypothetical protein
MLHLKIVPVVAIKLIKRMKALFEEKIGIMFANKETVLELNGCSIEAYPSNHLDAFRCPRCSDTMTLSSDFDGLLYICQEMSIVPRDKIILDRGLGFRRTILSLCT